MGDFITQTLVYIVVIWVNTGLHFVCENKVELVLPTKRIFTKSFHKRPCSIFTSYGPLHYTNVLVTFLCQFMFGNEVTHMTLLWNKDVC
jgi:hypothetical protein